MTRLSDERLADIAALSDGLRNGFSVVLSPSTYLVGVPEYQCQKSADAIDALLAELKELRAERDEVPEDVCRLVIAARETAYGDQERETLDELDKAAEAFASRVPWDDEPTEEETND